jgi:hypothetical protein
MLRGSLLRQTLQPQPITGTPTLVPDPSTINCPVMSVVTNSLGNALSLHIEAR